MKREWKEVCVLCLIVAVAGPAIWYLTTRASGPTSGQQEAREWCEMLGVAEDQLWLAEQDIRAGDTDKALKRLYWVRVRNQRIRDDITRRLVVHPSP